MPFEKDPNEIGVLWNKTSAKGSYFTGMINGENVVVFAIKSDNPKAPNWRVLKAQPRENGPNVKAQFKTSESSRRAASDAQSIPDDDDIGF